MAGPGKPSLSLAGVANERIATVRRSTKERLPGSSKHVGARRVSR